MITIIAALALLWAPCPEPLPRPKVEGPKYSVPPGVCQMSWNGQPYRAIFYAHGLYYAEKLDLSSTYHGSWSISGDKITIVESTCGWQYQTFTFDLKPNALGKVEGPYFKLEPLKCSTR